MKKQINKFLEETGYTLFTNEFGVRKDYKNKSDWRFVSIDIMLKDFIKWMTKNKPKEINDR